jgi:signal transduction histidine kinase
LIDLSQVVKEIADEQAIVASRKNIQIICHECDVQARCSVELLAIRRCIRNVVNNAVKYSNPGSVVHLSIARMQNDVRIDVQDSGPGVHPDDIASLFKPFGKTRNRTTAGETSSGLGLALSREIIHRNDGQILFENVSPHGARFSIVLPVAKQSQNQKSARPERERSAEPAAASRSA